MAAATQPSGLIDTNILIDASHKVPPAVAFVTAQRTSGGVQISIVTTMELITGCRDAGELARVQRLLRRMTVWPITAAISQHARQLMESFFLSHNLTIPDALIAATAHEQQLILYTLNTRHFQMIPGLAVVRPY